MHLKGERIVQRVLVLGSANLFASAIGFLAAIAIARGFGPEGLGLTNLAASVVAFALASTTFGTDLYAFRKASASPETIGHQFGVIGRLRTIMMIVSYSVMMGVVVLIPQLRDATPLVAVLGLSIVASPIAQEWLPQFLRRTDVTALASAAAQSIYFGLLLLVIFTGGSLWMVLLAKTVADTVVALGVRVWIRRSLDHTKQSVTLGQVLQLIREAWPLYGTQLLRTFALASDIVILGILVSREDLGHYSAASRIFYLLMAFTTAYFVVLLPRFSEAAVRSNLELRETLRRSLKFTVPLALLAVLAIALTGRWALKLGFGESFSVAAPSLTLLAFATLASLIGRHYRQILISRGQHRTDLRVNMAGAATHILSKIILIPMLGFVGAAVGTLLGEAITCLGHRMAALRELNT